MKIQQLFPALLCIAFIFLSCNPECDNITLLSIDSAVKQTGQEVLIKSNNLSALEGKNVLFGSDGNTVPAAGTRFVPSVGLLATVPDQVEGENIQVLVEDLDCGTSVVPTGMTVGDADFFANNLDFIPPAPFEIVIPSPPTVFPPLVQNAWVSPQNLDYCIWFKFLPQQDADGNPIIHDIVNGDTIYTETRNLDPYTSKEFSVELLVGCTASSPASIYHDNPVFGVIDKEENLVHFWIDRTGQGNGIEEFSGQFVDIEAAGYYETKTPECNPSQLFAAQKQYLLLATSLQSGRQLLLYQQGFN